MGPPVIVELKDCEYNKQRKAIIYRHTDNTTNQWSVRFPREIIVTSHATNRKVVFRTIGEDHPKFDQDQWDGEQQIYEHTESALKTVDLLYVTAQ
jgi:hypothetical protein